jgi:hypothetical protein
MKGKMNRVRTIEETGTAHAALARVPASSRLQCRPLAGSANHCPDLDLAHRRRSTRGGRNLSRSVAPSTGRPMVAGADPGAIFGSRTLEAQPHRSAVQSRVSPLTERSFCFIKMGKGQVNKARKKLGALLSHGARS